MITMLKKGTKYIPSNSIGNIYTPYKVYGHFNSFDKKTFYDFVIWASFCYNDENGCVINQDKNFTISSTSAEEAIDELKKNLPYYLVNIENLSCFETHNLNPKLNQIKQVFIRIADGYYLGNNYYKKNEVDSPYKAVFTKTKNLEAKKELTEYSFLAKYQYYHSNYADNVWGLPEKEINTGFYSDTADSLENFKYQFNKELFFVEKKLLSCYIQIDPKSNETERT